MTTILNKTFYDLDKTALEGYIKKEENAAAALV